MFPLTIVPPKTREGFIVSKKDKLTTFREILTKKKKILFFDLDGTLIDTVEDLNCAVNYALTCFNYPTKPIEQTKADIGNGVSKLIERSIPNGLNNPDYDACLEKFKEYYSNHYMEKSKPYEGMDKILLDFREKGYRLAVVTNKYQIHAENIINKFYPNLFEVVVGLDDTTEPKPNSAMLLKTKKLMRIRRRNNILYIGDTNVDLETAKNAYIQCILVTWGYRTRRYLINLKGATTLIDSPGQLFNYLTNKH